MLLLDLVQRLALDRERQGRTRAVRALYSTYRSVSSFSGNKPSLSQVFSSDWLLSYQRHLYASGVSDNTVSFYMRTLRSMYNQAVSSGLQKYSYGLFSHVFTGTAKTVKRAICPEVLKTLLEADLADEPSLAFCRDLFMLSFYLQGISFVDIAFLRKSDLKGNVLTYRRRKTGSSITLCLPPQAKEILCRYEHYTKGSSYLFPIITNPGKDEYLQYESALRSHNRRLKLLAQKLNIQIKLTSYVARHSWATTAYHIGIPVALISQAMGHKTEEITRIYLASFDIEIMTEVNQSVFSAIMHQQKDKGMNGGEKGNKKIRHLRSDGQLVWQR